MSLKYLGKLMVMVSLTLIVGNQPSAFAGPAQVSNYQKKFLAYDIKPVKNEFSSIKTFDSTCDKNDSSCAESYVITMVKREGIKNIAKVLSKLPEKYINDCYQIHPSIGIQLGYEKILTNNNIKSLSSPCTRQILEGFFAYYFDSKSIAQLKSIAPKYCFQFSDEVNWSCSIRLGSAFVEKSITDPVTSVGNCYLLPSPDDSKGQHRTLRRACMSGGWQSFFENPDIIKHLSKDRVTAADIFSFCLNSKRSAKEVCLQEDSHAFWYSSILTTDNEKFSACRTFSEIDLQDQCYFGMGRGIANISGREPNKVISLCSKLINFQDRDYCFIAAGEALNRSDVEKNGAQICKSNSCLRALGEAIYGMSGGDVNSALQLCKTLKLSNYCQGGVYSGASRIGYVRFIPDSFNSIFSRCASFPDVRLCQGTTTSGGEKYVEKFGGVTGFINSCNSDNNVGCSHAFGFYIGSISKNPDYCSKIKNISDCVQGYMLAKSSKDIYKDDISTKKECINLFRKSINKYCK